VCIFLGENMKSLRRSAPDLFCLDLYKYFDVDRLVAIAAPVKIETGKLAGPPPAAKTP
jgi:hypothetical protein